MKDIEFEDDVPSHVKQKVLNQVNAGSNTLDLPEGYEMHPYTGEGALDVRLRIRKSETTE